MLLTRWWYSLGFAARLTGAMVILISAAIALVTGVLYQQYHATALDARFADLGAQSQANAGEFSQWLAARQDEIRLLAQSPAALAQDPIAISAQMLALSQLHQYYDSIYLLNLDGRGLAGVMQTKTGVSELSAQEADAFNVADRDWFRAAVKGQAVFSEPVISRATGNLVSTVAIPVIANNQIIAVARGAVKIDTLIDRIGALKRAAGTEIYLIEQRTAKAVTPAASVRDPQQALTTQAASAISARSAFTGIYPNAAGVQVLGSAQFIDLLGWGLVVEQQLDEALRQVDQTRGLIILIALAALAVTIALCLLLVRGVTRLLGGDPAQATRIVQRVADGNLDTPIILADGDRSSLLAAISLMQNNLREMMGNISGYAEQVASAATELAQINIHTAAAIEQQSNEINNSAAAMNEMSAALDEVARNTQATASASVEAQSAARAGDQAVATTINAITALADEVRRASGAIAAVKSDSDTIDSVMEVIKSIAEQTNLLALNAAIEAARAGESGRGFAVVADEVRGLASRTKQSTNEIQTMIEKLQNGSIAAVDAMQVSAEGTRSSVSLAQETGQSLSSILHAVKRIDDTAHQIASATEQQTQVAREINQSIHSISSRVEETADHVKQSQQASESLAQLAGSLQGLVAQFRL